MGSVILFNAARMQEIEDGTVVSGLVNGAGNLILRRKDDSTFDAGKVTADNLADASTTVKGIVQLSTNAEALSGLSDMLALTPANLEVVLNDTSLEATYSQKGLVRLSTEQEASDRLLSNTAITPSNLSNLLPSGVMMEFAGATQPAQWLFCNGQSLLRADYPTLFAAIGITYGAADSSRFNVPDKRGRVSVGRDAGQTEFDRLGEKGGAKTHTLSVNEMPAHRHNQSHAAYGGSQYGTQAAGGLGGVNQNYQYTSASGSSQAHNNLQPYIALNHIIKI